MSAPPSKTNWVTVVFHERVLVGRVKEVKPQHRVVTVRLVGLTGTFPLLLEDENVSWFRGKYDPTTERGQAFLAEYAIQRNA